MTKAKRKITKKTIKPGKDITASIADALRQKLLNHIENGIVELTIDLKGTEMVDSVGLGVLIATHNSLENVGGSLTVKNVSPNVYNLFNTMRLDQHFKVTMAK